MVGRYVKYKTAYYSFYDGKAFSARSIYFVVSLTFNNRPYVLVDACSETIATTFY